MHQDAVWYSADPTVTLGQLKKDDYVFDGDSTPVVERCDMHHVDAIVASDTHHYHYKFSLLPNPPYIVYYMWDISLVQRDILAIVWPRAMSPYGQQVVEHLFAYIPQYALVTISGGADGVDMLTHQLSMEHQIPTIVVLGGWLRWACESRHQSFLQKVVDHWGLILSEFKLDLMPTHYTFPQRNRIVAWLADVVCVPEAQEWSGSLITVDFALDMHKPIYGVPNSIFSKHSLGLHHYIWSTKISLLYDIPKVLSQHFHALAIQETEISTTMQLDPLQQDILRLCMDMPMTLEILVHHTQSDMTLLLHALTMLEMYGLILQSHPGEYRCAQKIAK